MLCLGIIGLLVGFVMGLLAVRLAASRKKEQAAQATTGAPVPVPNRRQRAAAMLAEMRQAGETLSRNEAAATEPPHDPVGPDEEDEEDWEDEEDDSDEEESEVDEEYERVEALRLKLVFVVLHGEVKLPAQDVAVLVSSAGVAQIERVIDGEQASATTSTALVRGPADASADTHALWREWYAGWNLVGCAKITLKTTEEATLKEVFDGAQAAGLPCSILQQSYLQTMKVAPDADVALSASAGGKRKKKPVASTPAPSDSPVLGIDPCVVVAIGPAPADNLDPFTGTLKLFS